MGVDNSNELIWKCSIATIVFFAASFLVSYAIGLNDRTRHQAFICSMAEREDELKVLALLLKNDMQGDRVDSNHVVLYQDKLDDIVASRGNIYNQCYEVKNLGELGWIIYEKWMIGCEECLAIRIDDLKTIKIRINSALHKQLNDPAVLNP